MTILTSPLRRTLVVLSLVALSTGAAFAASDHVRARQALASGEIMALDKILAVVAAKQSIQVLEIELDDEFIAGEKRWIYEIKGLASESKVIKLKVDARNGEILSSKTSSGRW